MDDYYKETTRKLEGDAGLWLYEGNGWRAIARSATERDIGPLLGRSHLPTPETPRLWEKQLNPINIWDERELALISGVVSIVVILIGIIWAIVGIIQSFRHGV